jgi:uncharacterized membrane protein YbhN (UPF0104 family)
VPRRLALPALALDLLLAALTRSGTVIIAGAVVVAALLACVAVTLGSKRARSALSGVPRQVRQGVAVLRQPSRCAREVALPQVAAWTCRLGVAFFLLAAFDLHATVPLALIVLVAGSVSTLVPLTPGGVGAHQALLAYVLSGTASTARAVSFSLGMQLSTAAVDVAVGLAALMLLSGTLRPLAAARAGLRVTRPGR